MTAVVQVSGLTQAWYIFLYFTPNLVNSILLWSLDSFHDNVYVSLLTVCFCIVMHVYTLKTSTYF